MYLQDEMANIIPICSLDYASCSYSQPTVDHSKSNSVITPPPPTKKKYNLNINCHENFKSCSFSFCKL